MIVNIVDSSDFINAGKNILGRSWSRMASMILKLSAQRKFAAYFGNPIISDVEFWSQCRDFLAEIIATTQHAAELIIKGKIVAVNPMAILDGDIDSIKMSEKIYKFTDIKTVDAKNILKICESVTGEFFGHDFSRLFNQFRLMRNKYIHSVDNGLEVGAAMAMEQILFIFKTLSDDQDWCQFRLSQLSSETNCESYSIESAQGRFRNEVIAACSVLPTSKVKKYLGLDKKGRFVICPLCSDPIHRYYTAYVFKDGLKCYGCNSTFNENYESISAEEQERLIIHSTSRGLLSYHRKSDENDSGLPFGFLHGGTPRTKVLWPKSISVDGFAKLPDCSIVDINKI